MCGAERRGENAFFLENAYIFPEFPEISGKLANCNTSFLSVHGAYDSPSNEEMIPANGSVRKWPVSELDSKY